MSLFNFLNPFTKTAASDLDKEIAAIQQKAGADIAAAKLKAARVADDITRASKKARWEQFSKDYEAYLAGQAASSPLPAPTGATGPAGAA